MKKIATLGLKKSKVSIGMLGEPGKGKLLLESGL